MLAATAADAAQEQTTELAEVSTRVATLTERAESLETTLDRFELSEGDATVTADSTVVEFWHAMGGEKALLLEDLAREFESEHDDISLSLTSKGSYSGTLNATLEAADAGQGPAIAQVFEIGSTRARDSGHFRPVEELLPSAHVGSLLDPVSNYYRIDGTLQSLPFNASNPILAYNRDMFREAGLDPDTAPATFDEVHEAAERLVSSGVTDYGITFANYSWFVEQWFAEADELLVDNENGRAGTPMQAHLDGEFAHSLLEWWKGMEDDGVYFDPGIEARGKAKNTFHDEDAAMVIGSTSSLRSIESGADFDMGTGMLPVLDQRTGVLIGALPCGSATRSRRRPRTPSASSSPGSPSPNSRCAGTGRRATSPSTRRRFPSSARGDGSTRTPTTPRPSTSSSRRETPSRPGAHSSARSTPSGRSSKKVSTV
jgi:sn-glycerol 3-phosphate transport system substrate-binding protein